MTIPRDKPAYRSGLAVFALTGGLLVCVGGLLAPNLAPAAEWIGLTGVEVGAKNSRYAFLGAVVPLPPAQSLGNGWVQRYWLDWIEYRFDSNGEVRARAPGFSASLGYQQSAGQNSWGLYAGVGYRDTKFTPDLPNSAVRGSQSSLLLLAETDRRLSPGWRFVGAAQIEIGPEGYWTRGKILHVASSGRFWHGPELIFQGIRKGDPDYHATKLGYVLDGWQIGKAATVNFKAGAIKTKGLSTNGYVGIEFVGSFGGK